MQIDILKKPQLKLMQHHAVYVGPIRDNRLHDHYAAQFCVALEQPFFIRSDIDSAFYQSFFAFVPSQQLHQIQSEASQLILVFIEPDSTLYRSLLKHFNEREIHQSNEALTDNTMSEINTCLDNLEDESDIFSIINIILSMKDESIQEVLLKKDSRIEKVVNMLSSAPREYGNINELAKEVNISSSRLRHLFKEQVGISIKRYRLWCKLKLATYLIATGTDLTEASLESGFSDSAHLSKTYREMFGITPTQLWKNLQNKRI
jgi:AraC-like DNA-binding protein